MLTVSGRLRSKLSLQQLSYCAIAITNISKKYELQQLSSVTVYGMIYRTAAPNLYRNPI
jgi:hypothetical protein